MGGSGKKIRHSRPAWAAKQSLGFKEKKKELKILKNLVSPLSDFLLFPYINSIWVSFGGGVRMSDTFVKKNPLYNENLEIKFITIAVLLITYLCV